MKKRTYTISRSFLASIFLPGGILLVLLLGTVALSLLYINLGNPVFLYILAGFVFLVLAIYAFFCFIIVKRLKKYYIDGLYKNTAVLMEKIKNNDRFIQKPISKKLMN